MAIRKPLLDVPPQDLGWDVLEMVHLLVQSGEEPGRWSAVVQTLSCLPTVAAVLHGRFTEPDDTWQVTTESGPASERLQEAVRTLLPMMQAHATQALRSADVPELLLIPLVGHQAHYGWMALFAERQGTMSPPELLLLARHAGALLGLWADRAAFDGEAVSRIEALYRAVVAGHDVVLRGVGEQAMFAQILDRLMGVGLLTSAAITHDDTVVCERGVDDVLGTLCRRDIIREDQAWGELLVTGPADVMDDPHVQDLLQWAAELLGHGLDEYDIRQALKASAQTHHFQATHDVLTGLPNRAAFLSRLTEALSEIQGSSSHLVIGMMDMDKFKAINDQLGHDAGDDLLRAVATRLGEALPAPHFAARMGGDEFALLWVGVPNSETADGWVSEVMEALHQPVLLASGESVHIPVTLEATLGLTFATEDDGDANDLLRHADQALYQAKKQERRLQPWAWYQASHPSMSAFSRHIPQGIVVYYQPIVDVRSGDVQSLEALVRLWDGQRLLAPGQFLPALTVKELQALTFRVLDHVLEDMLVLDSQWRTTKPLSVSVNLEPSMLSPDVIQHIGQQVQEARIGADRITMELLETSDFLSQVVARRQLQVLKSKKFQLALDDVGSAYSSLLRIKELPIDTLKLDQAFVRSIPEHPDDLLFVISMQTLARGFHSHFVAEGVETREIWDALQVLKVDRIQGYVLTKPLALDQLVIWGQNFRPYPADGQPHSWLGAYAAHLAYQFMDQVPAAGSSGASVEHCPLTQYLSVHGEQAQALAREHAHFHEEQQEDGQSATGADRLVGSLLELVQPLGQPQ